MADYLSPGVYAESFGKSGTPIEAVGASTGGFVGITARGPLHTPILVTSWQSFLDNFAYGLETPFLVDSDLAYSVYGFFQNGGSKCYVIRTASSKVAKASVKVGETTINAKDEGTWGNKLKIAVKANADESANFDITVKYAEEVVEQFVNVSNSTTEPNYFVTAIGASKFISCLTGTLSATTGDTAFTGGADGITDIADDDYKNAIKLFDSADDVNLICVPGQTSDAMNKAIAEYATTRGNVFAILDGGKTADVATIKTLSKALANNNAALYYPWIRVADPLSKTGALRDCPACGHIMGVYARTIQSRGVWKAPAGVEANLRGAVEVVKALTRDDCDTLNPANVNAIMPRANYGIVVWGARSLSTDHSLRYVSDVLLNTNIKDSIKNGTQWAVFEPNNSVLWTRVQATVEAYLNNLWRDGGLKGDTAAEAYFVKCDAELNTEEAVNAGKLICEVGYAPNKPAEFVIFRVSHSISNG